MTFETHLFYCGQATLNSAVNQIRNAAVICGSVVKLRDVGVLGLRIHPVIAVTGSTPRRSRIGLLVSRA